MSWGIWSSVGASFGGDLYYKATPVSKDPPQPAPKAGFVERAASLLKQGLTAEQAESLIRNEGIEIPAPYDIPWD